MMEKHIDLFAVDLNQPTEVLARWWNTWNCWGWPEDLPRLKPFGWDELPIADRDAGFDKHTYIWPVMHAIQDRIGMKECLRWHHIHNLNKTNRQFEEWYQKECHLQPA
jgi:hypothetical protein